MTERTIIASDLNGTLTTGSPVLAVYRWLTENQPESCPPLFKYRLLLSYLLVKVKLKEIDTWGEEAMRSVLGLIRNPDPETLDAVMEFVVDNELWPKRRQIPVDLLQDFHHQGFEVYIISAAYHPAVELFSQKIASDRTYGIGTPVEITPDGLKLADQLNSRARKLETLLEAIGSQKLSIALGDTFADIPMLEIAESAIAVHPDNKLRWTARELGWKIIE
jgi:phosphoserine phosphatase